VAIAIRDHAGWPAASIAVTFPRENIDLSPQQSRKIRPY
jgi:DNA-binding IclR family transcriptional regulator